MLTVYYDVESDRFKVTELEFGAENAVYLVCVDEMPSDYCDDYTMPKAIGSFEWYSEAFQCIRNHIEKARNKNKKYYYLMDRDFVGGKIDFYVVVYAVRIPGKIMR